MNEDAGSVKERHIWPSQTQFYMSVMSFAIGLGNFWRLPPLVMRNGGGAFLIPYILMIVLLSGPLFMIELAVGQKYRTGSVGVWKSIHPALGGVGLAATIVCYLVAVYYNGIVAYVLYYLHRSISIDLPWTSCPAVGPYRNECTKSYSTPAFFFNRIALNTSSKISEWGGFQVNIFVCLLIAWIVVYLSVRRGVKTSGYVMYVTCLFPYLTLFVFMIHAMTLDGAWEGLAVLMKPDLSKVFDANVWLLAATQGFFNFGIAFGGLIAYGSYNRDNHTFQRDAVKLTAVNLSTSILTVIWVFFIEGHLANHRFFECYKGILEQQGVSRMDSEVERLRKAIMSNGTMSGVVIRHKSIECSYNELLWNSTQGTGLAFVVFTEAMTLFPVSNVSSVVFYLMLITLGLGSMFGTLEGVITCAVDAHLFGLKKPMLTLLLCGVAGFIGIIAFTFGNGQYMITLLDTFCGSYALLIVAFCEIVAVVYVYGVDKFCRDIQTMTGSAPHPFFYYCWKYLDPFLMAAMFVGSLAKSYVVPPTYMAYDKESTRQIAREFPWWSYFLVITIIILTTMPIPFIAGKWLLNEWKKTGVIDEKDVENMLDILNDDDDGKKKKKKKEKEDDEVESDDDDEEGKKKKKKKTDNEEEDAESPNKRPSVPNDDTASPKKKPSGQEDVPQDVSDNPTEPDPAELYPTAPFGEGEDTQDDLLDEYDLLDE